MLVIILFILILNVVSILLMYRCLVNSDRKEKLIFIAAGTALMYILTSIVYWISTRGIEMTEVSQTGKDLIIFAFVPVNGIIIQKEIKNKNGTCRLAEFAKSFTKFKDRKISGTVLRNRGIVLGVVLLILLILECIYFKNIQEQVVNYITEQTRVQNEQQELDNENLTNTNSNNDITNTVDGNVTSNIVNDVINAVD